MELLLDKRGRGGGNELRGGGRTLRCGIYLCQESHNGVGGEALTALCTPSRTS